MKGLFVDISMVSSKKYFILTAVAGSVCLSTPFKLMERPFLRDVAFYIAAGFWAYCIFHKYVHIIVNVLFIPSSPMNSRS